MLFSEFSLSYKNVNLHLKKKNKSRELEMNKHLRNVTSI